MRDHAAERLALVAGSTPAVALTRRIGRWANGRNRMADRLTTCPVKGCGAELRATVARYLEGVELDPDSRRIVAYGTWHGNDPDGFAWDHEATRVYCNGEDEHELTGWCSPHAGPDGWAKLGGYGEVPSPIAPEADALRLARLVVAGNTEPDELEAIAARWIEAQG